MKKKSKVGFIEINKIDNFLIGWLEKREKTNYQYQAWKRRHHYKSHGHENA